MAKYFDRPRYCEDCGRGMNKWQDRCKCGGQQRQRPYIPEAKAVPKPAPQPAPPKGYDSHEAWVRAGEKDDARMVERWMESRGEGRKLQHAQAGVAKRLGG